MPGVIVCPYCMDKVVDNERPPQLPLRKVYDEEGNKMYVCVYHKRTHEAAMAA